MKCWIPFAGIVMLGVVAIVASELQKVDVSASPASLLYLIADTEQELTRMPVSFARMSDAEEIRVGDELARSYSTNWSQQDAAEAAVVEHYLTRVGSELANRAHHRLPYRFHYIQDPNFVNALALPGGHVYVGAGLLALMDSEDELAAVMGHEIEHIDHYHCSDRVQQNEALRRIPLGGLVALPIGWWRYIAQDYPQAVQLLSEAVQLRPGDVTMGRRLAWSLIEVRRYEDALARSENANYEQQEGPEKAMIKAVAHWHTQQREDAMSDFNAVLAFRPEWGNLNWVHPLFSPLVAKTVQEMQAELKRRREEKLDQKNR
jgi:tetratricopeptide (TPR) repeat protein